MKQELLLPDTKRWLMVVKLVNDPKVDTNKTQTNFRADIDI